MRGNRMSTAKAKNFKSSFLRLMGFLKPYSFAFFIVLLLNIAATAFTAIAPKILSKATNEIARGSVAQLSGSGSGIDFGLLGQILLALMVTYLLASSMKYIDQFILSGVTQRAMYDLRRAVDVKLNKLPFSYLDKTPFGDTLSRVTNDVDTISNSLQQSLNQAISSVLSIIMVLVMMISINPFLTVLGLITMPIGAWISGMIIKKSQKYFIGQQNALGGLNGYVEEMYNGFTVIKAFGREKQSLEEFDKRNEKLYGHAWKAQFFSGVMMPVISFLTNVGYVMVTIFGGLLVIAGGLQVGDIQALIQYMRQFSQPVAQAANIANILQSAVAAAERIFELLDETEEVPETAQPVELTDVSGSVEFQNVQFGYDEGKLILKGITASVEPGQKIAIVGPTGSGKTTLVNLLLRFYDVSGGDIRIDSHSIYELTRQRLRNHFGMVLQDTWLFKGSIQENIRYGKHGASDEEVVAAAKAAYADRFIRQLPGGYQFELGENATNISQGQRQLLTIARAILSDPEILILDEATSSVDTRTELLIQSAMLNLMEGRTSFVIAHRLSTIKDADNILVIKDGELIEVGDHETLLAKGGFYEKLYNSQFAH